MRGDNWYWFSKPGFVRSVAVRFAHSFDDENKNGNSPTLFHSRLPVLCGRLSNKFELNLFVTEHRVFMVCCIRGWYGRGQVTWPLQREEGKQNRQPWSWNLEWYRITYGFTRSYVVALRATAGCCLLQNLDCVRFCSEFHAFQPQRRNEGRQSKKNLIFGWCETSVRSTGGVASCCHQWSGGMEWQAFLKFNLSPSCRSNWETHETATIGSFAVSSIHFRSGFYAYA